MVVMRHGLVCRTNGLRGPGNRASVAGVRRANAALPRLSSVLVKLFGEGVKNGMAHLRLTCQYLLINKQGLEETHAHRPHHPFDSFRKSSGKSFCQESAAHRPRRACGSLPQPAGKNGRLPARRRPCPGTSEFEQWKEDAAFERAIGRLLAKALLPR